MIRASSKIHNRWAATATGTGAVLIALSACQAGGQAGCTLTLAASAQPTTVRVQLTAKASPKTRILTVARIGSATVRRELVVGESGRVMTTYTFRRGLGIHTITVSATTSTGPGGSKSTSVTTTTITVPD
jgi:hypothetical protein